MAGRQYFSTQSFAAKERLDSWNGFIGQSIPGMTIDGPTEFHAEWTSRTMGEIRVARIRSQKARIRRRRQDSPWESDRAFAQFQTSGGVVGFLDDQVGCIQPGELSIRKDCGNPYSLDISDDNAAVLVEFCPASFGFSLSSDIYPFRRSAAVENFQHYVMALLEEEEGSSACDEAQATEDGIIDVFGEMVAHLLSGDGNRLPLDRDHLARAVRFIDEMLCDSSLRTSMIADELSISVRQVQRIFAPLGMTLSQFIYKRRVNLAAYRLRSGPRCGNITELAMELGFSDAAHMCRLFRRQIGTNPMRYAALAGNW